MINKNNFEEIISRNAKTLDVDNAGFEFCKMIGTEIVTKVISNYMWEVCQEKDSIEVIVERMRVNLSNVNRDVHFSTGLPIEVSTKIVKTLFSGLIHMTSENLPEIMTKLTESLSN